jgi:citrate lyase subunit beta/citryl-CoA lyase
VLNAGSPQAKETFSEGGSAMKTLKPVQHPREVLMGSQAKQRLLPACDHYCGVEARMQKSLAMQLEYLQEFGVCVFDVTLDCEDGAPVGGELDHANMVVAQIKAARDASDLIANQIARRIGVRVHAVDHSAFAADMQTIVSQAGNGLNYVMVPKVESVAQVEIAVAALDAASPAGLSPLPLHVLIESPLAVHRAFDIAAHPRVESVSFGLMDFVSAHGGAIPEAAMRVGASEQSRALDQFHHPLVVRAKTEIASACHAFGKVPSHCVVTEFKDVAALELAARSAARLLGFTRMWSIHPSQIRPILRAFAPDAAEVELAAEIIVAAQAQEWAPIAVAGRLHDRASYRYFWQVLERAHQTGVQLPEPASVFFKPVLPCAELGSESAS